MTLESFDAHVYTHLHIYLFINYPVIYQTILQWISIFNCSINIPYVWLQNISVIKSAVIFFSTLTYTSCFLSKAAAFLHVNIRLLCLHNHVFLQRRNGAPDTASHPPSTWESNSNWLPDRGGLRLQPYSKKAGQRGAQVQIVFYKSPLRGICVYPWPLICCWGSLGKRETRGWKVDQRGEFKRGQNRVFVLLLDLRRGELREGGTEAGREGYWVGDGIHVHYSM